MDYSDKKFIFVKDEKIKQVLENAGYRLFKTNENFWVFLNNNSKQFSQLDNVVYSNILTF